MASTRRQAAEEAGDAPAADVRKADVAPVLDDREAALRLRNQSRLLREQAGQLVREANAAHIAAEQGVRTATRDSAELHTQAAGLEREAQRLERRVVLADQADRLAVQVAEGERELAKIVDEHGRLTAELDDLDGRLADLRGKAEEAASGIVFAQASGDSAAVATHRLRARAVDEVRAEAAGRRETVAERLAAVSRGGDVRTYAEKHVAELRSRRDKVLRELDPTLLDRRGDIHRHVERLAGADVEEQIASVTALLSAGAAR